MADAGNRVELALVSHLPEQQSGGGMYAVSWQVFRQLRKHFTTSPLTVICDTTDRLAGIFSRLNRRILRLPGAFYRFSKKTLIGTSDRLTAELPDSDAVFFRSSTRWAMWRADRPYFVHTDVCFHTFFYNTFQQSDFALSDLERIWQTEAAFLDRASAVFFESRWGLQKTIDAYGLSGENFFVARNAGALEAPCKDVKSSDKGFLIVTIAKHFQQKGGDLVAEAFRHLKPDFPELAWHIVGGTPPTDVLKLPDVFYEGFLRPDVPKDLQRMRTVLGNADLLLHPTREDTNPLVLVEAASFGCPCISVRSFAIPELVADGETGILLNPPLTKNAVVQSLESLLLNPVRCQEMRRKARAHALANFSWDSTGQQMATLIRERLS